VIRHIVLMSFLDPADAPEAQRRLVELTDRVPAIRSLQVGLDIAASPANSHLCLTTEHEDLQGLAAYQAHPDHEAVVAWLRPRLAGRAVCDHQL
jgi:hypothetical protein